MVWRVAKHQWLAASQRHLRRKRNAITVPNLKFLDGLIHGDNFVASRKNRHARFLGNQYASTPYLRGHRELGIAQPLASRHDALADSSLLSFQHEMRAWVRGPFHNRKFAFDLGMLDHHDRIGPSRQRRAGHDLHARPGLDDPIERRTRASFTN